MLAFDIETWVPPEVAESEAARAYAEKHGADKLALNPAFGRICAVAYGESAGAISVQFGEDERAILKAVWDVFNQADRLSGHNIKKFDVPFLAVRFLANGLTIPNSLRVAGKKPWEISHVDTMELLQFGGGPWISLDAACSAFGAESPKTGMDGSLVQAYAEAGRFEEIGTYCVGDVRAWAAVYSVMKKGGAA